MLLTKEHPTTPSPNAKLAAEHPFLLLRREDFPELQARAKRSPWRYQKADAIRDAQTVRYHASARIDVRSIVLANLLSTTALAYILDPDNRPWYRERIVQHLRPFDADEPGSITAEMRANPNKMLWTHGVPTGNAFVQAVLALDVIHDDLPAAELKRIEAFLRDGPARYFRETPLAWHQGTWASAAIFALYEGDAATYEPIVARWVEDTLGYITPDGVFTGGTGYADARWSFADREHKALFGEILAHVGLLPQWYDEPRLGKFQEWLNGYAYTPFRMLWAFGDGAPGMYHARFQPGSERAYRYSPLAGRYAAWLRDGLIPPAGLGSYVLTQQPPAAPLTAPSRVFPDGGAWLKQANADQHALAAALWNLATPGDAHAHKETNSLNLAAYGEMLLRGSGYNGWATAEQGFGWSYIHDRAIAGNVVLFDYAVPRTPAEEQAPPAENDHVKVNGEGIVASLLTGGVDFARGDSGDAIPNGRHWRNLLFVHPADGAAGYCVVVDELAAAAGSTGQVVWHPASASVEVEHPQQQYTWTTREFSGVDVGLTVYLATPPGQSVIRHGVLANWGKGIVGKYLVSDYPLPPDGRTAVVTVLFPHDASHPRADMARLGGDGLTGATVRQGDVTDVVFESHGRSPQSPTPGVQVQAKAGWLRQSPGRAGHTFWLMDGIAYSDGVTRIDAASPVTLYCDGRTLHVSTTRANRLTVERRELRAVAFTGDAGQHVDVRGGVTEFNLSAGTHALTLKSSLEIDFNSRASVLRQSKRTGEHRMRTRSFQSAVAAVVVSLAGITQAGVIARFDFSGPNAWPAATTVAAGGATVAAAKPEAVGTIDVEGSKTPTDAYRLSADSHAAAGPWSATLLSGPVAVKNAEKDLRKLTLGFMLTASAAQPVTVRVESFDADGRRTGGLEGLVYPAAPNFYQRYSVDLSTLKPAGDGTFDPTAPKVQFGFAVSAEQGWPAATGNEVCVDNVSYASPAYYVSTGGNDKGDGRTEATAFATARHAAAVAKPGDIILIKGGTYAGKGNSVTFPNGGTPDAWVVLKNAPGETPVLTSEDWNVIRLGKGEKANPDTGPANAYIEIRGLTVQGTSTVDADGKAVTPYPKLVGKTVAETNQNGICVEGRFSQHPPHHIRVADCTITRNAGAGIGFQYADWAYIENNTSSDNAWWTCYACSGISMLLGANTDGTEGGYRFLIRHNRTFGNRCYAIWTASDGAPKHLSDGNGIIIDTLKGSAVTEFAKQPPFTGRTLVQGNLSFNNGGSGMHALKSDRVDFINNTMYLNSASPELHYAQTSAYWSDDVRFINNIIVAQPGEKLNRTSPYGESKNSRIVRRGNLYFGGDGKAIMGEGDRVVDPRFVRPATDPRTADFRLQPDSPALTGGVPDPAAPRIDLDGRPVRPDAPTVGAFAAPEK